MGSAATILLYYIALFDVPLQKRTHPVHGLQDHSDISMFPVVNGKWTPKEQLLSAFRGTFFLPWTLQGI